MHEILEEIYLKYSILDKKYNKEEYYQISATNTDCEQLSRFGCRYNVTNGVKRKVI